MSTADLTKRKQLLTLLHYTTFSTATHFSNDKHKINCKRKIKGWSSYFILTDERTISIVDNLNPEG